MRLSSQKLELVFEDWEKVKALNDYERVAGKSLFQNLFEKCPEAKPLFGFPMKMDPRSSNLLKSFRFARHAKFLVQMVDKTVTMLGSETSDDETERGENLSKILIDLGKKHVAYGVKPEFFPFMTQALLGMLKETIGKANSEAWEDVFGFLIFNMEAGHRRINKGVAAENDKSKCMKAWDRLSKIGRYKEHGGAILFQNLFALSPGVKVLFGFPADIDPNSQALLKSSRFAMHSKFLMEMMEKTVGMLGDDDETLTSALTELGQKHVAFGVKAEFFPYMTDSLILMMKELLGDDFTDEDQQAFENVMSLLIMDMVRGQRKIDKDLAGHKKSVVIDSWAKLTKISGYEEKGGILLFQNVFEMCPEAKLLFGFPLEIDPRSSALQKNERFLTHSKFLLSMIEKTVGMLGENNEELTKVLLELGKKHVTYGVKAEYFPFMNKSIVIMMKEMLGGEFTFEDQQAWEDIIGSLIADMVKGQRTLDMGLASTYKNITKRNWEILAEIEDYDEKCGIVIFEHLFKACPEAKRLFGFKDEFSEKELRFSTRLLVHASFIVEMIEKAMDMLGSDPKELEVFMEDLGRKHISYGVKPEYMPVMQESIIHMLKTILGEQKKEFSKDEEAAWDAVLSALVANMTKAQREQEMKKIAESFVI